MKTKQKDILGDGMATKLKYEHEHEEKNVG